MQPASSDGGKGQTGKGGGRCLESGRDQKENEWVIVLEGAGTIFFESGVEVNLKKGDYLNIPAHIRHKVTGTDPHSITIWLAIHYW